ncbi:hypothetical protein BGZ52_006840 [Haplosporangium bisporale]|nr:hypothetical protein BGZ52_006840 [Haplosporangium bisporale]KAF9211531.1 hypothetical protein BGZ59_007941 [Podila verticillata]KFH74027.1 hypothetical protein MVEG_01240 [Podila verticillata NRRL 6337]
MRKALSLITVVGLLASLASAAPTCFDSDARNQEVFTHAGHREPPTKPRDDGGIIYLPPTRSRKNVDLNAMMQEVIQKEMTTTYNQPMYLESLKAKVCGEDEKGNFIAHCQIQILSRPVIRVIPTRQISDDIICTTATCTIGFAKSVSVSTTHSAEVSLSITAGAKPFGIGMEFTTTVGYGYSNTAEESTTLSYNFDLVRGEAGYIGMANAEVSADVRVSGCRCNSFICSIQCSSSGPTMTDTGHHQAVILKNGIPRGFVSFIFTS